MCGIAFAVRYGNKKLDLGLIEALWRNMEIRGTDASGYYFERGTSVSRMVKAPIAASEHWKVINDCDEIPKHIKNVRLNGTEKLVMLHTRKATHGCRWNNDNNMPIYSNNFVMVHNGTIKNKRLEEYSYIGEVDSEEVLAQLETQREEHMGDILGTKLEGGRALIIREHWTDKIYLYRHRFPLEVIYDKEADVLYGCSESELIPHERSPFQEIFKKREHAPLELPEHNLFSVSLSRREVKLLAYAPDTPTAQNWDYTDIGGRYESS